MGEASFFKNPLLIDSNSTCYLVIGGRDVRFESLPHTARHTRDVNNVSSCCYVKSMILTTCKKKTKLIRTKVVQSEYSPCVQDFKGFVGWMQKLL